MARLTDSDVARLRELWAEGWNAVDLAAEFDISRQHVGRIVRDEQRVVVSPDADRLRPDAVGAVEAFLESVDLDEGWAVVAATARALAAKLDACSASEAVAVAQAIPRIAAELVDVLDRLRGAHPGRRAGSSSYAGSATPGCWRSMAMAEARLQRLSVVTAAALTVRHATKVFRPPCQVARPAWLSGFRAPHGLDR